MALAKKLMHFFSSWVKKKEKKKSITDDWIFNKSRLVINQPTKIRSCRQGFFEV